MFCSIKKNTDASWAITPTSGKFAGHVVATAEGIEMTSVVVGKDQASGLIKAVWGLQIIPDIDVFSDTATIRALCLGRAFNIEAERPVRWSMDGIYDIDSGRILRRCKRMVLLGSSIFRRG